MNSYWVVHASAQKNNETTKSLKMCYLFNNSRTDFKTIHRRTKMMYQQRVSGSGWRAHYWTRRWRVASTSTACVRAGGHFKHML